MQMGRYYENQMDRHKIFLKNLTESIFVMHHAVISC
jgi:hypothetical protein